MIIESLVIKIAHGQNGKFVVGLPRHVVLPRVAWNVLILFQNIDSILIQEY